MHYYDYKYLMDAHNISPIKKDTMSSLEFLWVEILIIY